MNRRFPADRLTNGLAAALRQLAFVGCIVHSFGLAARPVTEDEARRAAANWLGEATPLTGCKLAGVAKRGDLWVVSLAPTGYLVLTGSDIRYPVVAYAKTAFAEPEQGSPFHDVLAAAGRVAAAAETNGGARHAVWVRLTGGGRDGKTGVVTQQSLSAGSRSGIKTADAVTVNPFLTSHWNQHEPCNDYCPINNHGTRVPSGCVATAAAQMMYFWQWPWRAGNRTVKEHEFYPAARNESETDGVFPSLIHQRFDGNLPFDWQRISDYQSTSCESNRLALARLHLWLDNLLGMSYCAGSSGADFSSLNWSDDFLEVYEEMDRIYTTDPEFNTRVAAELQAGYPVSIGLLMHRVVAHGCRLTKDGLDLYLNYGWGGASDGWYHVDNGEPDYTKLFSFDNALFVRARKKPQVEPLPPVSKPNVTVRWHWPRPYKSLVSGFEVSAAKEGFEDEPIVVNVGAAVRSHVFKGLSAGERYVFTVTPLFEDGDGESSDGAATRIAGEGKERRIASAKVESEVAYEETSYYGDWNVAWKLPGRLTRRSRLTFSWGDAECLEDGFDFETLVVRFVAQDPDGESHSSTLHVLTNRVLVAEDQPVSLGLADFAGREGTVYIDSTRYFREVSDWGVWKSWSSGKVCKNLKVTNLGVLESKSEAEETRTYVVSGPAFKSVTDASDHALTEGCFAAVSRKGGDFKVVCDASVSGLKAYSSHLAWLGDDRVTVRKTDECSYWVHLAPASGMPRNQRILLTLVATDSNGGKTYKDLSLQFDDRGYTAYTPPKTCYSVVFDPGDAPDVSVEKMFTPGCVYALPTVGFVRPDDKRFAGWRGSEGRRYDEGILVYDLAKPGATVVMTAIWE